MTGSFGRRARLALFCVAIAGCSSLPSKQPSVAPQQESEWTTLMSQVDLEIFGGRYDEADRLLASYVARNPASPRAPGALYWRALYKLDPANGASSPHDAITLLDSYLASPAATLHRADAQVLRRIAVVLEIRPAVAAASGASGASGAARDDKARDEELAKTKDELAKANAELERIKKRLAAPKP
jgi:hypothetical protein